MKLLSFILPAPPKPPARPAAPAPTQPAAAAAAAAAGCCGDLSRPKKPARGPPGGAAAMLAAVLLLLLPVARRHCAAAAAAVPAVGVCATGEKVNLLSSQRSLSKVRLMNSCPYRDTSSSRPAQPVWSSNNSSSSKHKCLIAKCLAKLRSALLRCENTHRRASSAVQAATGQDKRQPWSCCCCC